MSTAQQVNLSIAFDLQLTLTAEAVVDLLAQVRDAKLNPSNYPLGFRAASEKLPDDADIAEVLRVVTGEVTGDIVLRELPFFYPPSDEGFTVRLKNVVYLETPPRLDPPADAIPVVVQVGDKNVH